MGDLLLLAAFVAVFIYSVRTVLGPQARGFWDWLLHAVSVTVSKALAKLFRLHFEITHHGLRRAHRLEKNLFCLVHAEGLEPPRQGTGF